MSLFCGSKFLKLLLNLINNSLSTNRETGTDTNSPSADFGDNKFHVFFPFFALFHFFPDFSHYARFYVLFVFCYIIPWLPNNTKIFVHIKIFLFLKGNTLPRICLAVRRNCRPLGWDTLGNCLASLTEIESLTMLSETESGKQLCPVMIS